MTKKVLGNLTSINKQLLAQLEGLYDHTVARSEIISLALSDAMCGLSTQLGKEVAVYLSRSGRVEMVSVGSSDLAKIPEIWLKRNEEGLNGLRCIHTHPNGESRLSQADYSAVVSLHFDLICAIGVKENPEFSLAMIYSEKGALSHKVTAYGPFSSEQMLGINPMDLIGELEKQLTVETLQVADEVERAVMVTVLSGQLEAWEVDEIVGELKELSKTAGLVVVGELQQNRERPDAAYFLGKGKLEELAMLCQNLRANCVVFEKPLSPAQLNNLTNALGIKVVDKTTLILDIFAGRARSKEGKLQVELAQLNYLLPRLIGKGVEMSRQGGGVGTRGPGETKLESDRRHIRHKIQLVEKELQEVRKHREVQQMRKLKQNISLVALVGYTNAGKSSLLNALTNERIYAEDQLFATLDTTTRSLQLPQNTQVLLTDTVGFIRDLPHQLINAFKATLDELKHANLLLHVIDASNPNYENQIETVHHVLTQLGVMDKEMLYVFNKMDKVSTLEPNGLGLEKSDCCYISAKSGQGLEKLLLLIEKKVSLGVQTMTIHLPIQEGRLLNLAYSLGKVADLRYTENEAVFELTADEQVLKKHFHDYIVREQA